MNKVLYDNQCHFCSNIKFIIEKADIFKLFSWEDNSNYTNYKNSYNISAQLLENTIIVISKNNIMYIEFSACRYILSRIPLFYPILPFLYIPFLSSFFGNKLYRYISINRTCNNEK